MTRKIFTPLIGCFCLSILFAFSANADQWRLPKKEKYYSPNKKYYVEVVPKKLENQLKYFEDKVNSRESAGAAGEAKNKYAQVTLYKLNEGGLYRKVRSFPLVNEVSPVDAIISNNGNYIVTFDNWHNAGYGSDVVVIYRSDGSVVRQLALEDFLTENDIGTLPETVSSRWWGRDHYIDEKRNLLILRIVSSTESKWTGSALEGAKFYEVKLDLATGNLAEPKRDLLPRWEAQVSSGVDNGIVDAVETVKPPDPACIEQNGNSNSSKLVRISSTDLYGQAKSNPLPQYPALARAARVEGTVIVEILVDEMGGISCARALSGHPLLRAAAVAAAKKWSFAASKISGKQTQLIGNIAFHFRYVKIVPGRNESVAVSK